MLIFTRLYSALILAENVHLLPTQVLIFSVCSLLILKDQLNRFFPIMTSIYRDFTDLLSLLEALRLASTNMR